WKTRVTVAQLPKRTYSSLRALLSIRLNWTFSLRRLSPACTSDLPIRFSSVRLSSAGDSGVRVSGAASADGFSCVATSLPLQLENGQRILIPSKNRQSQTRIVVY